MNKKTSYIIIFSLLLVLTVGIIFTDYIKQLGTILADASVPNPGHSLSEIEGGQDLATKGYVDTAMTGTVRTSGDQIIGGIKTFSNTIVGTGIITNASGGTQPTCDASTRGLIWNEYGSSGQRDKLYICQKLSNNTYSFTFISEPACGYAFIDPRDSNTYPTVQIGDQCWMAKNLAYLPSVVGPGTGSETTPYYYVYGYDGTDVSAAKVNSNYTTYGVLYNWPAATTACPSGWHLPTDAEWNVLETYTVSVINSPNPQYPCSTSEYGWRRCADDSGTDAGGTYGAGKSLKKVGQGTGVGAGDDLVGFSALLAGARDTNGSFYNLGSYSYFRSSSASSSSYAWRRHLYAGYSTVNRDYSNKAGGFSVRCLRDWTI